MTVSGTTWMTSIDLGAVFISICIICCLWLLEGEKQQKNEVAEGEVWMLSPAVENMAA